MAGYHLCLQIREALPPRATSPNSITSSSCVSNHNGGSGGGGGGAILPRTPLTPKSIDGNPFPTTFIQADTSSFKQVVQMLTGSAETAAKHAVGGPPKNPPPAAASKVPAPGPKRQAFKLHERRGGLKSLKTIGHMMPALLSPSSTSSTRKHPTDVLSPSVLNFPSLALSPVTPLVTDLFNRTPPSGPGSGEEGFYAHQSPATMMPRREAEPPRLLPLFPLTSPRMSSASAAGSSA